jgi:hypothetical protein
VKAVQKAGLKVVSLAYATVSVKVEKKVDY